MDIEFAYTKHQTPRGARPDAEKGETIYLLKNVSELRLTYQIRLLAYSAIRRGKKLVIRLPKGAAVHKTLRSFVRQSSSIVSIEHA